MSDARSAPTKPRRTTRKRRDIRERMERAVLDHWELLDDEDIAIFTIRRPDDSDFPEFETGQYTLLAFWDQPADDPRPRQLSIASTPLDRDHLEFYVILVRDSQEDGSNTPGVFTGALWQHKPGDEILYMPQAGRPFHAFSNQPARRGVRGHGHRDWRRSSPWRAPPGAATRQRARWTGG